MGVFKQVEESVNKEFGDIKDLPKEEVERSDGLPTVKDLKEIFGKEKEKEDTSEGKKVKDFIEIIIKIDK